MAQEDFRRAKNKLCIACGDQFQPHYAGQMYCSTNCNATKYGDPIPPPNPSGFCMCGCGKKTAIAKHTSRHHGHVGGEHVRYLPHHHENRTNVFAYEAEESSDCWSWTGSLNGNGYGIFERRLAHRVAFERENGPIPDGMDVHHRCENRKCVNPSHLELVTRSDHSTLHGKTRHYARGLTDDQIKRVRDLLEEGVQSKEIAVRLSISPTTVSRIKLVQRYAHR